ncbi:hypothetical protein EV175_005705 [Coemansia sp. RSA 1933]|nr:hypothetical protein EV175_005705 [Coemansia sp. RSA 1933]
MLSSQELQEELALWGNAQFQLEPMSEDHSDAIKHSNIHGGASASSMVSPTMPTDAWGLMSLGQSQATAQPTADPLEFMVGGGASAADFLSAMASQKNNNTSSQQRYQGQQSAMVINGVPMLPLVSLPQQQQLQVGAAMNSSSDVARRQIKHTAIAAAPAQSHGFHQPSILPKGGVVPSSIFDRVSSSTGQNTKVAASKGKPALPAKSSMSASLREGSAKRRSDESVEDEEAEEQDEDDDDERKRTAVADKRRRNTAASARFRVKKKMREQALEQSAREMTAKAEALEKRVQELEMETRWLKSLITEKDPNALDKIHCPCHHPNGLEGADAEPAAAASHLHTSPGRRQQQQQQQLAIAPAPELKKAKRL